VNLLMTADPATGVWPYSLDLARALGLHGVHTTLVAVGEVSAAQRNAVDRTGSVSLHEIGGGGDHAARGDKLLAIAEQVRPHIIHLNTLDDGDLPWAQRVTHPTAERKAHARSGHAAGLPIVIVVAHDDPWTRHRAVHGDDPPASAGLDRGRVARSIEAADALVAPTAAMLKQISDVYGPHPNGCVLPHGRSEALLHPAIAKARQVFAAAHTWDGAKNLAALVDAAPRIRHPVRIAAPAHNEAGHELRFDNVKLLGHLSESAMSEEYANASIFVHPARYEPFGLSAVEAAFSGCALVMGDIPSLREVWGDAAVYVDPGRPEQIAIAVNALIDEPVRRRNLARSAMYRALRYLPEAMSRRYLGLYRELLADRGVKTPMAERIRPTEGLRSKHGDRPPVRAVADA